MLSRLKSCEIKTIIIHVQIIADPDSHQSEVPFATW